MAARGDRRKQVESGVLNFLAHLLVWILGAGFYIYILYGVGLCLPGDVTAFGTDAYQAVHQRAFQVADATYKADRLRYSILGGLTLSDDSYKWDYGRYPGLTLLDMEHAERRTQASAEAWDEAGITAYINQNPSFTMEDYERVLAEASDISASVKEYLLKGKASGLSICDMTYEQLCELRSGMDLLSNSKMPGSNSDASNNCETYYQQMGQAKIGND